MKILLLAALRGNLSAANSWKFDFGAKKSEPGYIAITSDSVYRAQAGYGFVDASAVEDVDRRAPNPLLGNFCTSASPMFFNVDLPEGNYNVTVHLGDQTGESDTTIKTES